MKTGNDLVAEQVRYSTCLCCLPNCANQRNFAVLQRIDVCLLYSSIGRIDSFLSFHWFGLFGYSRIEKGAYRGGLEWCQVDTKGETEDQNHVQHSIDGNTVKDIGEVFHQ